MLRETIDTIANWGGLGGRISQGNGLVQVLPSSELPQFDSNITDSQVTRWVQEKSIGKTDGNCPTEWANKRRFFSKTYVLSFQDYIKEMLGEEQCFFGKEDSWNAWKDVWKKYQFLPIAYHVRDTIRGSISNQPRRHEVYGIVQGRKVIGSKVFVSHGYAIQKNTKAVGIRIYGYNLNQAEIDAMETRLKGSLSQMIGLPDQPLKVTIQELGNLAFRGADIR